MDKVVVNGVTYVRLYYSSTKFFGDPSGFLDHFNEKERDEIRLKMIVKLIEAGHFKRKDEYKKKNSIYKNDELFYGL
jgi:hypothetical protein